MNNEEKMKKIKDGMKTWEDYLISQLQMPSVKDNKKGVQDLFAFFFGPNATLHKLVWIVAETVPEHLQKEANETINNAVKNVKKAFYDIGCTGDN